MTIRIEGKEYELELQDEFASYILKEFDKHLSLHANNKAKDILGAYLKKCYECYVSEKKLQNLLKKL